MFIELYQSKWTTKGDITTPISFRTSSIIAIWDHNVHLSDGSLYRVVETKDQILQIMKDQETEAYNKMRKSYQDQTGQTYPL
jgi:hypothetical protein